RTIAVNDDVMGLYLFMMTGHDGRQRFIIRWVATRVVCANTASVALNEKTPREVTIVHNAQAEVRISDIRKALGFADTYFKTFAVEMQQLPSRHITSRMYQGFLDAVAPIPSGPDVPTDAIMRAKTVQETIAYLFREGRGNQLATAADTAWGAFNSVT